MLTNKNRNDGLLILRDRRGRNFTMRELFTVLQTVSLSIHLNKMTMKISYLLLILLNSKMNEIQ